MELQKPVLAIVVLFLSAYTVWSANPSPKDFNKARYEVMSASEIHYDSTLCDEIATGEDKLACRLKDVPSIGFLVCKKSLYEENETCKNVIRTELDNLLKLRGENIKVVTVDNKPIENVKCGETNEKTCSGFLEAWIDKKDGEFGHIRDHIEKKTVSALIKNVLKFASKEGLQTTITDLRKIVQFMQPTHNSYKQICDLQGFFLKNGGFLINDTPVINEKIAKDGACWPGEPTTEQVLEALNEMINELNKSLQ